MSTLTPTLEDVQKLEMELMESTQRLAEMRRKLPEEKVQDYELIGFGGEKVRLSDAFGDKNELIAVHNMGKGCSYCTLWADGFIGFTKHLEDRAAFVVTTPDDPEAQRKFARDRGWNFRMLSTKGTTFKHDMGFEPEPGKPWPGVSVFRKDEEGNIYHTAKSFFGPGDAYCGIWHLFDLLPSSDREWHPKYRYADDVKKDMAHS